MNIKKFLYVSLLGLSSLLGQETRAYQLDRAWVTYATANYFPLAEVLVRSVQLFSKYPIIVVGVNADPPFSHYPCVITKRIDIPLPKIELPSLDGPKVCLHEVWFQKPQVILDANVKEGIFIDADSFLSFQCDKLFDMCGKVNNYPLSPISCNIFDPENRPDDWWIQGINFVMDALKVKACSMPYVTNPMIIFSEKCFPFIRDWGDACLQFGSQFPEISDETFYNVLLWQYEASDYLSTMHAYFDAIKYPDDFAFTGCKNPKKSKRLAL